MLEVAYWVVQSSWLWLFAMDFLFLSAGMFSLCSALGESLRGFKCFIRLTFVIGMAFVLNFIFLLDLRHWMIGSALGAATTAVIGCFLMPSWLFMLGRIVSSSEYAGL